MIEVFSIVEAFEKINEQAVFFEFVFLNVFFFEVKPAVEFLHVCPYAYRNAVEVAHFEGKQYEGYGAEVRVFFEIVVLPRLESFEFHFLSVCVFCFKGYGATAFECSFIVYAGALRKAGEELPRAAYGPDDFHGFLLFFNFGDAVSEIGEAGRADSIFKGQTFGAGHIVS